MALNCQILDRKIAFFFLPCRFVLVFASVLEELLAAVAVNRCGRGGCVL